MWLPRPAPARAAQTTSAREATKFILLGEGDHAQPVFPSASLPAGPLQDKSRALCPSNLPALSEIFVGRQELMQRAVAALVGNKRRCIYLVGAGGIGKTGLAVAVAHYVRLRHAFKDGVHAIDARGLTSTMQLIYAIAAALRLPGMTTEDHAREELLGALVERQQVIVIDRCDLLCDGEHAEAFADLLSVMLRRAPRLKLLLTCRKMLGVPGEQPLTISVNELSAEEAKQMLRQMAQARRTPRPSASAPPAPSPQPAPVTTAGG